MHHTALITRRSMLCTLWTHPGICLRWSGLRDNQACRSGSGGPWWGYGTARTRCHSRTCCGRYTGTLRKVEGDDRWVRGRYYLFISLLPSYKCWAIKRILNIIIFSVCGLLKKCDLGCSSPGITFVCPLLNTYFDRPPRGSSTTRLISHQHRKK